MHTCQWFLHAFAITFPELGGKVANPLYKANIYLDTFEWNLPSSPHAKHQLKPKESWWFRQAILREFPSQTTLKTCTKWKVFGPGPHLGPKCRQGAPEYQENDSKTKHSGLPIFHFSRNPCKKIYIIVYVFWYFWGPFPWISCHTSKTIDSDRTGRRGFDAISATFSRPENNQ